MIMAVECRTKSTLLRQISAVTQFERTWILAKNQRHTDNRVNDGHEPTNHARDRI